MTPLADQLRAAKALIPTSAHWSSVANRQCHAFGHPATADHPDTFCTVGAAQFAVTGGRTCSWVGAPPTAVIEALVAAGGFADWVDLTLWNDDEGRTLEDVHALYDRAIAEVEAAASSTPEADTAIDVMAACDALADTLTNAILAGDPQYDRKTVRDVVGVEVFMCAQDMKMLFAPVAPEEWEAIRAAIRDSLGRSA